MPNALFNQMLSRYPIVTEDDLTHATREIMQQELSRIWNSRKKTVVFITHDIDEALILGDRIAIMTAGPAASIKSFLNIDLPRPRDMNEELLRLRRKVKAAIEEEVTKAMRQVP